MLASKITAIFMAIIAFFNSLGFLTSSKVTMFYNVAYGEHSRQVMDVAFPDGEDTQYNVVLFIHGGAWIVGSKSEFSNRIQGVSDNHGCITASMNYRYASDDVDCEDMLDDIDMAIAGIKSFAESKGISVNKVMLAGFSAGAHLAMLYAYTRNSTSPLTVAAVASYSGPTDLSSEDFIENNALAGEVIMRGIVSSLIGENVTKANFGSKKDKLLKVSPVNYVTSSCVPTLVVQGGKDQKVHQTDTRIFVDKLKAKHVTYKYFEIEELGHQLDEDESALEESNEAFGYFIDKYLK